MPIAQTYICARWPRVLLTAKGLVKVLSRMSNLTCWSQSAIALQVSCRHSGNAMRNYVSSTQVLRRNFASRPDPHAFSFFPEFFSRKEQSLLLSSSLKILDSLDTRLARRRRADFFRSEPPQSSDTDPLELFAPDDLYHFQEVSLKAILTVYACFTDIGTL